MDQVGLYEFAMLPLTDRIQLVWEQGTFLINVKTNVGGYNLYALFNYFVEVEVTYRSTETIISNVIPFVSGERLAKYLDQVDLTDWVANR